MMEPSFLQVNGLNTAQVVLGESGPPIVMLHGWGANIDLMLPLAQCLTNYRNYVLDLPGFGKSEPPPVSWTVHDYTNFVLAYMDCHQLDRAYLIGHSFGGRLGLVLGAEHPVRFIKMSLIDSAGVRTPPSTRGTLRLKTYHFALNALS